MRTNLPLDTVLWLNRLGEGYSQEEQASRLEISLYMYRKLEKKTPGERPKYEELRRNCLYKLLKGETNPPLDKDHLQLLQRYPYYRHAMSQHMIPR